MLALKNTVKFRSDTIAWGSCGSGPPLVMIHGTPFSSQVWRRIAPCLQKRRTLYYFDLLGYGQSTMRSGQDVSLGVQNDLLEYLFVEWNLDAPEVLCHDFGGATALRGWILNGLRYARLTLLNPVAIAPWGSDFVAHIRQHEAAFAGLPAFAHDALLDAYLQGAAARVMPEAALKVYRQPWQGQTGQSAFYRQIAQMDQAFTDEVESRYSEIDCPMQLLWGERDAWIPLEQGKLMAQRLPHCPLTVIPDAGHLVQEDSPEAIVAAVLNDMADANPSFI